MSQRTLGFVPSPVEDIGARVAPKSHPGFMLLWAMLIGCWAGYLIYLAVTDEPAALSQTVGMLRWTSLAVFSIGFVALLTGASQKSTAYPLILFALLQEGVLSLFTIGWAFATRTGNVPWQMFGKLIYSVLGTFAAIYAAILLVSLIVSLIAGRRLPNPVAAPVVAPAPEEEAARRRIKSYFKSKPWWPWFLAYAGLSLAIFAVAAPPRDLLQFSYPFWTGIVGSLFLLSLMNVVASGGRHLSIVDARSCLIMTYMSYLLLSLASTTFVRPQFGNSYWTEQWPTILSRYFVVLGIVLIIYSMTYRFFIHRYWRRASDREIEATASSDTAPMLEHGLAQLGVERPRLVAEPLMLRGLPDRDAVGGAFIGSHIGKDDVLRFTPQRCTVFAFTDDQVHYYEGTVDLTTGRIVHELVVEFFYQDISNVARANGSQTIDRSSALPLRGALFGLFSPRTAIRRRRIDSLAVNDTIQFEGRDLFQINLESGRALSVVLRDDSFFDIRKRRLVGILKAIGARSSRAAATAMYQTDLPTSDNDRVIRSIRALIRDKKRSLLGEQI